MLGDRDLRYGKDTRNEGFHFFRQLANDLLFYFAEFHVPLYTNIDFVL